MITSKICSNFGPCDSVDGDVGYRIGIPPVSSWAGETTRCIDDLLPIIAFGYIEHLFNGFQLFVTHEFLVWENDGGF